MKVKESQLDASLPLAFATRKEANSQDLPSLQPSDLEYQPHQLKFRDPRSSLLRERSSCSVSFDGRAHDGGSSLSDPFWRGADEGNGCSKERGTERQKRVPDDERKEEKSSQVLVAVVDESGKVSERWSFE